MLILEFTQECASNGLGLVYQCGDEAMKKVCSGHVEPRYIRDSSRAKLINGGVIASFRKA